MTTHMQAPKARLHGNILKRAGALTAVTAAVVFASAGVVHADPASSKQSNDSAGA